LTSHLHAELIGVASPLEHVGVTKVDRAEGRAVEPEKGRGGGGGEGGEGGGEGDRRVLCAGRGQTVCVHVSRVRNTATRKVTIYTKGAPWYLNFEKRIWWWSNASTLALQSILCI
jgi:hypothetical protein